MIASSIGGISFNGPEQMRASNCSNELVAAVAANLTSMGLPRVDERLFVMRLKVSE